MEKTDKITIHDGRGNVISMKAPDYGGKVEVDFHGHFVCLKAVDRYGSVKEHVCAPLPQSNAQPAATTPPTGKSGCGCP